MTQTFLLLQEAHSSVESEKPWSDEFNDNLYYSHGKTNSCKVQFPLLGDIALRVKAQVNDSNGRILIYETEIDETEYLIVNLCIANTEFKTLKSLSHNLLQATFISFLQF